MWALEHRTIVEAQVLESIGIQVLYIKLAVAKKIIV
jgi:hypothetical protein